MVRLIIFAAVVSVALMIYTLIECARSESHRVRSLPKPAWYAVIVLLPLIGAALWFVLGRPVAASGNPSAKSMAPDDDEDFLRQLEVWRRQQQREEDLKAREQDLTKREQAKEQDSKKTSEPKPDPKNKAEGTDSSSSDTEKP